MRWMKFTGCRLCRRPLKLEEYNYKFMIFWILCSRDHANLVRIEFSSKLPQELCLIIEYASGNVSQTCGTTNCHHFCQKLNFYRFLLRNRLGQNVPNDRGIISDFYEQCDFDMRFACQSPCFPENLDSHFLCLNNGFLFGGQICEAFMCLE